MNNHLNLAKKLLIARDITGIAAEYLIQKLHYFDDKHEQHLIYAMCSNLHRAAHLIELSLIEQGMQCENRPYQSDSFKNVKYLDVDLVEVIKKHIRQKEKSQQALNGKGQKLFRLF